MSSRRQAEKAEQGDQEGLAKGKLERQSKRQQGNSKRVGASRGRQCVSIHAKRARRCTACTEWQDNGGKHQKKSRGNMQE